MFAIPPGKRRVLVNWGKVFVSVKLWPVGWAALTAFNARRAALEALDPGGRGTGDVFLGVASTLGGRRSPFAVWPRDA